MLQRHIYKLVVLGRACFYSVPMDITGILLWVNQGTKENKKKLKVTISQAFWIHGIEHI